MRRQNFAATIYTIVEYQMRREKQQEGMNVGSRE